MKTTAMDRACTRIVRDETLLAKLLAVLEEAQVALDEGPYYAGEVLEVAASVRAAISETRRRLRSKAR